MKKILLVDDEVEMRNNVYEILSEDNYQIICAARGQQALQLLKSEKPDLVIMDLMVPGEIEFSLLKKIKETVPDISVALFSGSVTAEIEKEAYRLGAIEVLRKGRVTAPDLRDCVRRIFTKQSTSATSKPEKNTDKILIVDDEDSIRSLLSTFFTKRGFQTIAARTGEDAVRLLSVEKPSVILLDINMPGMDGIMTLKKIKEIDPNVGVVMATGVQDEEIVNEAMALGAYHYVLKPFDLKYLELVVISRISLAT